MESMMPSRSLPSARSDSGFSMIEVIVSAAVLALVALAVLSGIDGATSATGRERARSVAATLAESDQERLREMPVEQLASYTTTNTPVTVGKATYNVASRVEWVHDSTGGTASCANDTTQSDYLHITSTVTSNIVGSRTAPVQIHSIVAPNIEYSTTHGSLAVKVVDHNGLPVSGLAVTLAGAAAPLPQTTNAQGCALFQMIPAGDYTMALNNVSMVDHNGNTLATAPATVSAGLLTLSTMEYDYAGTVNTTIESYQPGTSNVITSYATRVSAVNGADLSMLRNIPDAAPSATPMSGYTASKLYPFSTSYSFFSGTCRYSNPTNDSANANYFATYPGAVQAPAGGTVGVKIRQPPLNVQWYKLGGGGGAGNSPPADGLTVTATPVKPTGESCVEPSIPLTTFTTTTGNATYQYSGWVGRSKPNAAYVESGVPFGYYNLCFQRSGPSKAVYPADWGAASPYDNTDALGLTAPLRLDGTAATWHSGTCP
jgi:prepilin-type N-terminal cleavage/methylation domain-containing protein